MADKDSMGDRLKRLEAVTDYKLMRRVPCVTRLDGKAFSTLTAHCEKPFDLRFSRCMDTAAMFLAENIQGCKLAYVQSDEISLLLTDWETYQTESWFDYRLSKLLSVSAGMAVQSFRDMYREVFGVYSPPNTLFDCRAFNVSKEEVINVFRWRQQDCIRNSISALAQSVFSHRELQGCSQIVMKEMLLDKGVDWEKQSNRFKYGGCVVKTEYGFVAEDAPDFMTTPEYVERYIK